MFNKHSIFSIPWFVYILKETGVSTVAELAIHLQTQTVRLIRTPQHFTGINWFNIVYSQNLTRNQLPLSQLYSMQGNKSFRAKIPTMCMFFAGRRTKPPYTVLAGIQHTALSYDTQRSHLKVLYHIFQKSVKLQIF